MKKLNPNRTYDLTDIIFLILLFLKNNGNKTEEEINEFVDIILKNSKRSKDKIINENTKNCVSKILDTIKNKKITNNMFDFEPSYYIGFTKKTLMFSIKKDGISIMNNQLLYPNKKSLEKFYEKCLTK